METEIKSFFVKKNYGLDGQEQNVSKKCENKMLTQPSESLSPEYQMDHALWNTLPYKLCLCMCDLANS